MCIFCGKDPKDKNLEHVIPEWLISLTGNPNRIADFSCNLDKDRKFAFDQFRFPSCKECNEKFSDIESNTRETVLAILDGKKVEELESLLLWFDKVRIGLWLAFYTLDKNYWGIEPKFYITERLSRSDRGLFIYKSSSPKGINFFGVSNNPLFNLMPSCFGLRINEYYFLNFSTDYLFSKRLGLPHPGKMFVLDNKKNKVEVNLNKGKEKVLLPVIKRNFTSSCIELYQPIINKNLATTDRQEFYSSAYVKKYFDERKCAGKIVIVKDNNFFFEGDKDFSLSVKEQKSTKAFIDCFDKEIRSINNKILSNLPSLSKLSKNERNEVREVRKLFRELNKK